MAARLDEGEEEGGSPRWRKGGEGTLLRNLWSCSSSGLKDPGEYWVWIQMLVNVRKHQEIDSRLHSDMNKKNLPRWMEEKVTVQQGTERQSPQRTGASRPHACHRLLTMTSLCSKPADVALFIEPED
ncbi:uncharacterized protein V6R79_012997 [Siganus canaliculatus]